MNKPNLVRILLADDHPMIRQGLRAVIEAHAGWELCAEAANGYQAVELARQRRPAIAILDFSMPELNGLEAARQIRQELPQTEVLLLTMHESEQLVRETLAAGARGFISKTDAAALLVSAVEALSRHEPFFSPKITRYILNGFLGESRSAESPGSPSERLTARERQIVQLVAEGKSTKEIAGMLDLSAKTVETHRANLMGKLGLRSISDLVRYAIRNRIIEP